MSVESELVQDSIRNSAPDLWASTAEVSVGKRRMPPRLDADDFARAWRGAHGRVLGMAAIAVIVGLVGLAYAHGLEQVREIGGVASLIPERLATRWYLPCFGVVVGLLLMHRWATAAPRLRRDWEAYVGGGFIAERHATGLRDSEAGTRVWLLLDTRIEDRQAYRIHRAVAQWLPDEEQPESLRTEVIGRIATDQPLGTEKIFGPNAAGGHLVVDQVEDRWSLFVPRPDGDGWSLLPCTSVSGEAVSYSYPVLDEVLDRDRAGTSEPPAVTSLPVAVTPEPIAATATTPLPTHVEVRDAADGLGALIFSLLGCLVWVVVDGHLEASDAWQDHICGAPGCITNSARSLTLWIDAGLMLIGLIAGLALHRRARRQTLAAIRLHVTLAAMTFLTGVLIPRYLPDGLS